MRDWSRRASGRMVRVITKWAQDWCNKGWGPADVRKPDNDEQVNTAVEEVCWVECLSSAALHCKGGYPVWQSGSLVSPPLAFLCLHHAHRSWKQR